jgi:hypothetical protein
VGGQKGGCGQGGSPEHRRQRRHPLRGGRTGRSLHPPPEPLDAGRSIGSDILPDSDASTVFASRFTRRQSPQRSPLRCWKTFGSQVDSLQGTGSNCRSSELRDTVSLGGVAVRRVAIVLVAMLLGSCAQGDLRCSVRPNAGGRPPTPEDGPNAGGRPGLPDAQRFLGLNVDPVSFGALREDGRSLKVWPTLRPKSGPLFSASHRLHGSYARRDRDWQGVVVPRAGVTFRGALSPNPSRGGPHPLAKQTRLRPEAGGRRRAFHLLTHHVKDGNSDSERETPQPVDIGTDAVQEERLTQPSCCRSRRRPNSIADFRVGPNATIPITSVLKNRVSWRRHGSREATPHGSEVLSAALRR